MINVFAAMRLVSSPAAGWAVNRFGERTIMSSGLAIVGLSSLAAGFATDYVQLLVPARVGGAGSAMFTISATALLLRGSTGIPRPCFGLFQADSSSAGDGSGGGGS